MNSVTTRIALFLMFALFFIGCSSSKSSPVTPQDIQPDIPIGTSMDITDDGNRQLLGVWNLEFDCVSLKAIVTPSRLANTHYQVKYLIPTPEVVINAVHPNYIVDADVTLTNPFTFDAYDVRLILFTDDEDHILDNPDCWTDLYDIPEGLPINPFKAYAKGEPNRVFAGSANHTENLLVFSPPGSHPIQFAVDASVPANCEEPYEIYDFTQDYLLNEEGKSTEAEITVRDWQNDVDSVNLHCPQITGTALVPFTQIDPETWNIELVNNTGASAGQYVAYIIATSENSGSLALYNEVTIVVSTFDPNAGWAQSWGGDNTTSPWGMTVGENGDFFIVGQFWGTVDFDPGPGIVERTSNEPQSAFLLKLDSTGNFRDVSTWGDGADTIIAARIAIDSYGNIWVGGIYEGTVDFDPGPGVVNKQSNGSSWDIYLEKFSPNLDFMWIGTWGNGGGHKVYSIVIDDYQNVYVAGKCGVADYDPGPDEFIASGSAFFSKFDNNGNFIWVNSWGDSDYVECYGLDIGNEDNLYLTGSFPTTTDFDPGPGLVEVIPDGLTDTYLVKYNSNGEFQEVYTWGGADSERGQGICVDDSGNIYIVGTFYGTTDFDPGPNVTELTADDQYDIYLCKFNSDVNFEWVRAWDGHAYPGNVYVQDMWIDVDSDGSICVIGSFTEPADFDPGPGTFEVTPNGFDIFLTKYMSNGDWLWARTWGSESIDWGRAVIIDNEDDIYSIGSFCDDIDLDPGPDVDEHTTDGCSAYLMKLKPNGYWE